MVITGEKKTKNEHPTVTDVLLYMKKYRKNIKWAKELEQAYTLQVSEGLVSQYGLEAGMPKAQGGPPGDPVGRQVVLGFTQDAMLDEYVYQIRFIEHRQHRITTETHAMAFALRLQGYSVFEIKEVMECTERHVRRLLKECAEILIGQLSTEK